VYSLYLMKRLITIIRTSEWWEYKLAPLLAIGYATALLYSISLYNMAIHLFFLLVSVIVGAVYVSVINDITDLEDDLAAGKSNRMSGIPRNYRWMIPALCLFAGALFNGYFFTDSLSRLLYLLPWISFSLYSFPPVRLKKRGLWGVLADACGSHLFISLLIVADISNYSGTSINWYWFTAVGVWSFFYGLRGILWHQFIDRDNDLKINLKTFATRICPERFLTSSYILFFIECLAFFYMIISLNILLVFILLIIYLGLAYFRYKKLGHQPVLIISPDEKPYQIFGVDYYQSFFPVSLLIYAAFTQPNAWILLLVHLILFHATIRKVQNDLRYHLLQNRY
jgi:4-hydroxybenzoate polyprenyltransferase